MTRWWFHDQQMIEAAEQPHPEAVLLPRAPCPHECWDGQQFVSTPPISAAAIAKAHARKAVEATLIDGGVPIDGLLAAEARATGQDLAELARIVLTKAQPEIAAEVARIVHKRSK